MTGDISGLGDGDTVTQASEWFARMRGPDAAAFRCAFDEWCSDPDNAAAYRDLETVWSLAGAASVELRSVPVIARKPWRRIALMAATIAAIVSVGLVVALHERAERRPDIVFVSGSNAMRTVTLADGSRVTLDAASRIDVDLDGDERRVRLLAGRGRFAVAHDAAHPFVVYAGDRAVIARGTVFDVSLADGVAVTLIEGSVDLEARPSGGGPSRLGTLRPGEKASFGGRERLPRIVVAPPEPWPAAMLAGDGLRLREIVAAANRTGSQRITLADPALGALRLSGGIRPQQPRALARTLAAAFDLRLTERADGSILLERTAQTPLTD